MKPRGGEETPASGSRSGEDECGPDELILLLVYLYSLADEAQPAGQDTEEEELEKLERELIGALTLVITRETELSPLLQKLTGERESSMGLPSYVCCFANTVNMKLRPLLCDEFFDGCVSVENSTDTGQD